MEKVLIIDNHRHFNEREVFYGTLQDLKEYIVFYYSGCYDIGYSGCYDYKKLRDELEEKLSEVLEKEEVIKKIEKINQTLNTKTIEDCFFEINYYHLPIFGECVDLELIKDPEIIEKMR